VIDPMRSFDRAFSNRPRDRRTERLEEHDERASPNALLLGVRLLGAGHRGATRRLEGFQSAARRHQSRLHEANVYFQTMVYNRPQSNVFNLHWIHGF
jgi:hypothetical protein